MTKWFKLSTIAEALGVNPHTMRGWISKGYVFDEETKAAPKAGGTSYLDEDGARRIAIMSHLIALGISAQRAFEATLMFLDIGETTASFNRGDPETLSGAPMRDPGDLFSTGETLVVCPSDETRCYVMNVKPKDSWATIFIRNKFKAAAVLHLNPIVADLDAKLSGLPFEED